MLVRGEVFEGMLILCLFVIFVYLFYFYMRIIAKRKLDLKICFDFNILEASITFCESQIDTCS